MEKVGKMVLKIKPWKSGINKLLLSRQFRAACKKLERLNETFSRTQFIFRKGLRIFWKKFFARKGPLPLPNRFLRPTRVHLEEIVSPHPPDLSLYPPTWSVSAPSRLLLKIDSFRSWNWLMVFPNTWNFDRQISNYLIEHFSNHFFK